METIIIVMAMLLWGVIHSWLATQSVKDFVSRWIGPAFGRVYRLAYNAVAIITFLPILVLVRALPDHVIYSVHAPWLFLMLAGQALAGLMLVAALLQTGALNFAGIRQLLGGEAPSDLNTRGFYGWVRHPLYLFGLLLIWLTPFMTTNLLTLFGLLSVYLFVGALFEERRLLREFGVQYEQYRVRTPMIIPWLRRRRPDEAGNSPPTNA